MWRLLWIFISGLGALVMGAAGVSPEEAQSNLAQWFETLGLGHAPRVLQSAAADHYGMALGGCLLAVAVIGFFITNKKKSRKPKYSKNIRTIVQTLPAISFQIPIIHIKNDKSQKYAECIKQAINESGNWSAYTDSFRDTQTTALTGIKISVPTIGEKIKEADFIAVALKKANIQFDWWQDYDQKDNVRIIVALRD